MRIFIRTFGCTLNQSDSEVMAGLLAKAGHELVSELANAEMVLFNTCTVKDKPEKRFYSELKKVMDSGKKVVVAGCIPQSDSYNESLKHVSLIGVRNLDSIVEVVEKTAAGQAVRLLGSSNNPRLNLPKIRKTSAVEIIPIAVGCLGECSYCKTRFARGKLMSYEARAIKKQFEDALADGVKEVWLTSQDCGAYGKDINSSLPELLNELLKVKMNPDVRIRIGMINPNHALEFLDEYVQILKHPNVFKFAHLPVQSGSNNILSSMNRKYKAEDFVKIVKRLRKEIPMITIATDIICGFPGESDDDFDKTYKLLEALKIPVVNITKFSPRPRTPAARMQKLNTKIVNQRSSRLGELQAWFVDNRDWLGWKGRIIIDKMGKEESVVGRNDYYKPVVIKKADMAGKKLAIGDVVEVKVDGAMQNYLEASPV
jgi:threonylcarbamoyladenosine tRNA methylthiotransferase CDKAL1